jgi:hypothetical protein
MIETPSGSTESVQFDPSQNRCSCRPWGSGCHPVARPGGGGAGGELLDRRGARSAGLHEPSSRPRPGVSIGGRRGDCGLRPAMSSVTPMTANTAPAPATNSNPLLPAPRLALLMTAPSPSTRAAISNASGNAPAFLQSRA